MRQLTVIQVLEYYDVPQLLTASDAMGTRYLCTLFDSSEDEGYKYIGVQISEPRLMAFLGGQLDLRDAYLHPEVDNALYIVDSKKAVLSAKEMNFNELTDNMLPDAGYLFDSSDIVNDAAESDTYQLEVPVHDRMTFSTLVSRMGWRASSLHKPMGKVAVL